MKTKIVIILSFVLGVNISNAQDANKQEVDSFLIEHTLQFNKNQKPVFCRNIDSLSQVLNKNKINYSRCTYQFFGEVLSDFNLLGGGCNTYILDTKKPFIYYSIINNDNGSIIIEVLEGNNYF